MADDKEVLRAVLKGTGATSDGRISQKDLRMIMDNLTSMGPAHVDIMFEQLSIDDNGRIQVDEFIEWLFKGQQAEQAETTNSDAGKMAEELKAYKVSFPCHGSDFSWEAVLRPVDCEHFHLGSSHPEFTRWLKGNRFTKPVGRIYDVGMICTLVAANGGAGTRDKDGKLPLHWAAAICDVPLTNTFARWMKEERIDLDAADGRGDGALHVAAGNLQTQGSADQLIKSMCTKYVVAALLQHGCNPHLRNQDDKTPREVCKWNALFYSVANLGDTGALEDELCELFDGSAVLYSSRVRFNGSVLDRHGGTCIASFPGKYAHLWQHVVELGKAGKLSAAVVFLPFGCDTYGRHASCGCMCNKFYGRIVEWGCLWCERWMENVAKAHALGQELVVVYFEGQVGQHTATWEELPLQDGDERLGRGLGFSQRGELAFLRQKGYPVTEMDVIDFTTRFAA